MMDSSNVSDPSDEEFTSAKQDSTPVAEESNEPDFPQVTDSLKPPASPPPDPSLMEDRDQPGTSQSMVSNQPEKVASKSKTGGQPNLPKASASRPPTTNLSMLIYMAVATCQRKSGLSMQALKKIVTNMGYDMNNKKHYFLRSIKGMLAKGQLTQVKGTGANGSFKINPLMGMKRIQPTVKGRVQQAKKADKKKKAVATSQVGVRSKNKKKGKETSRATKRNKMTLARGALQNQVKV